MAINFKAIADAPALEGGMAFVPCDSCLQRISFLKTRGKKHIDKWCEQCRKKARYYIQKKHNINRYKNPLFRDDCIKRATERAKTKKVEVAVKKREWHKNRIASDPVYALRIRLGRRIGMAFKNAILKKSKKSNDLLGASWPEIFEYIEAKFKSGMTWDNCGEWHIDHITPLCSANNKRELEELCNYKNLQPLWKWENFSKGGKII